MAYEHVLKMLVGGLENTASDFEKLRNCSICASSSAG